MNSLRPVRSLAFLLAVIATALCAQVPQLINYQGRVAVGVVNFDGNGLFKFALVNGASTTTYWSNDGTSTVGDEPTAAVTLTVSKGLYSVLLGDTTLTNMTVVPASVFMNADVRLRVWFDDGVNGSQLLTPDQRIAAVGYAMMAGGLNLPVTTTGGAGVISQNGSPLLHSFGPSNLFAGSGAGNFTLTGSDNVGLGKGTMVATTTGHNNVAIGTNALALNTSGLANTAVGFNALDLVTTGNQNTANGAFALSGSGLGNNNTAIGYSAMLSDTDGSHNTALGHQALRNNTTGDSNIAIGKSAGINLTTGDNNIAIGNAGVAGESRIIRIGTSQTDTYLVGTIHGDGSGLTGITATSLAAGSVTSAQLANGAVGSLQLAPSLAVSGTVTAGGFFSTAGEPSDDVLPVSGMVWIKPGRFVMGSRADEVGRSADEGPQTVVTLTKGFWMGVHEVTQAEYQAVTATNPSSFTGDLNRPVETVSWDDAMAYCATLKTNEQTAGRIPAGWSYRLPTEAEWEYACRAGPRTTRFSFGDDVSGAAFGNYAWYISNSAATTHPVEQKLPNALGLMDMHGNVWEWCQDRYAAYSGGSVTDPQGPLTGGERVSRGASWSGAPVNSRSARRDHKLPTTTDDRIGFRIVLSPMP